MFRFLEKVHPVVVLVIVGVVLVALYFMMSNKNNIQGLENVKPSVENDNMVPVTIPETPDIKPKMVNVAPFEPAYGENLASYMPVVNGDTDLKPEELLPKSQPANEFSENFPTTDIDPQNFLTPNFTIGINTVTGSRKNGNRDLRRAPIIPKVDVGPWLQSTRTPDLYRQPIDGDC